MTRNYTKTSIFKAIAVTAIVVSGLFSVAPKTTHALNLIDPLCILTCNDKPKTVNNTYDNSNNTGNINSNGGTVVNGNVSTGGTTSTTVPVPYPYPVPTPVYNYPPVYYPPYDGGYTQPLNVTCYATPTYANIGESVSWRTSISGGNYNYYVTWSGTDGLYGNGNNISKAYYTAGSKNASVTVTSGNQSVSRNCSTTINVTGYNYNNDYNYNYNYNYDYNYNNYNYPLTVSCTVNPTFAPVGSNVQWSANVSGGNNSYTYQWRGTDGLNGSGQLLNVSYNSTGPKYAGVTVYSGGQSITRDCANSVLVGTPNGGGNGNGLQVACFADKVNARIGETVTWAVEVANGNNNYNYNNNYGNYYGNFTYTWTGSEGLNASGQTLRVSYNTLGQKYATVTVYSNGNIIATQNCGNSVNIISGTTAYKPPVKKPTASTPKIVINNNINTNAVTPVSTSSAYVAPSVASTVFSLQGIPWGWVAILVIIVLFGMVMYLFVNRNEIK